VFRKAKAVNRQKTVLLNGSGVNLEWFTVQPMPEKFAFLCISRLIRDKGVFEYLEACAEIKKSNPDVRCLLVCPYDSNPSSLKPEELQRFIDDGVIEYFGEQTDVVPYFAQCSVFVLPSYHEGLPRSVIEAMAVGRAIITSDVPGCRETVQDCENGYLVPVKNSEALYEKMKLLAENNALRKKMAEKSYQICKSKFEVNIVNNSMIGCMEKYYKQ
jgi:glycosyltransferase involved in cell wall biosynthesis